MAITHWYGKFDEECFSTKEDARSKGGEKNKKNGIIKLKAKKPFKVPDSIAGNANRYAERTYIIDPPFYQASMHNDSTVATAIASEEAPLNTGAVFK
jgi:hypothetical protein